MRKLPPKSVAGRSGDLGNEMQVVGRGDNRYVSHIESELGQVSLYVVVLSIPAGEALDSEAMSQFANSRATALDAAYVSLVEQRSQRLSQATTTKPCQLLWPYARLPLKSRGCR